MSSFSDFICLYKAILPDHGIIIVRLIAAYSSGGYEGHTPADPPGYAIQEGYEGFLIPMKTGAVTGLTIALSIVSVLLGLLSAAVFKLPVLTLLLLKIKKLIKLDLIKQWIVCRPAESAKK